MQPFLWKFFVVLKLKIDIIDSDFVTLDKLYKTINILQMIQRYFVTCLKSLLEITLEFNLKGVWMLILRQYRNCQSVKPTISNIKPAVNDSVVFIQPYQRDQSRVIDQFITLKYPPMLREFQLMVLGEK